MGALSKLDAINRMLRASGEYPVSTLAVTGSNDVSMAIQTLDEITMQCQLTGLNCNTVIETLSPDSNGKIYIPDTVLAVDTVDVDINRNIVQRGRNPTYLFDVDENTDVFTTTVKLKITYALPFEDLPTAEQF